MVKNLRSSSDLSVTGKCGDDCNRNERLELSKIFKEMLILEEAWLKFTPGCIKCLVLN